MSLVDVIVPTRNRPQMLKRALDSIQAQSLKDHAIYVVNDGGEDVSELVWQYPKANYIRHGFQKGCGNARNTGLRAGKSKYIAYLDDDDMWLPDHLETLFNQMQAARLVYSDAWYSTEAGECEKMSSIEFSREHLKRRNLMPVISVMHERSLIEECGLFDEELHSHEDYDLWIRFSRVTDFLHIEKATCIVSVRNDPGRMSLSRNMQAARQAVQEKHGYAYGESMKTPYAKQERNNG